MKLTKIAIAIVMTFSIPSYADYPQLPPEDLVLANRYEQGIDITQYWRSEKLDGIRAVWDGENLFTRNGNRIYAPRWFIEKLPELKVEGELWAGRGNFHLVQTTVLDKTPTDEAWKKIDFMLFDMPGAAGDYQKRYYNIIHWVNSINEPHIKYIEHTPIQSEQELFFELDNIDFDNGEGLMLRKVSSRYQAGRSNDLLKLKRHHDSEALVIGYKPGTGKYKGMMGSVLVRLESGEEFYIGSGFTDAKRLSPPEIGSTITFRYNGLTQNGIPKFARFVRERENH
ncbi:DNA ligase [Vibrio makurazakiensis]|uniref:DNA ligase n=1 Tax=Vibrio makurazakiensis TaxID=2910250 RepID=UPI003D0EECC3